MAWIYVAFAAVVEIFWVIGLRYSNTWIEWTGTIIAIIFSFYFIIKACEKLPSGTVYAVFTGTGAAAIVVIDVFAFHALFTWMHAVCIGLVIVGVIGLKVTGSEQEKTSERGL